MHSRVTFTRRDVLPLLILRLKLTCCRHFYTFPNLLLGEKTKQKNIKHDNFSTWTGNKNKQSPTVLTSLKALNLMDL